MPKPPGQRRRRNLSQPGWSGLPAEGRKGKPPVLPKRKWHPRTLKWWKVIWASPMATAWLPGDVPTLERLAEMVDAVNCGGVPQQQTFTQIRELEDRFGLNPKARRALQWEVRHAEELQQGQNVHRLRAVDGPNRLRPNDRSTDVR